MDCNISQGPDLRHRPYVSIGEFDVNPRPGKEASTAAPALPSPACGGGWSG